MHFSRISLQVIKKDHRALDWSIKYLHLRDLKNWTMKIVMKKILFLTLTLALAAFASFYPGLGTALIVAGATLFAAWFRAGE